jgi:UDP-N-acetylglucosamine 1-carboxyvinyltransferase
LIDQYAENSFCNEVDEVTRDNKMEKIVIKGGRKLKGDINVSGAKNAALPILAASLLTKKEVILHNIPRLGDVHIMTELVRSAGAKIEFKNNTISVKATNLTGKALSDNPLANEIRYSTHMIGALLPRVKKIRIPFPGGCAIGTRILDSYILGLTKLGAKIEIKNEHITAELNELHGSHIMLEYPSVSGTENTMILACLAKGASTIENIAKEPEIVDLANFLNSMGAEISGAGTDVIKINGVDELGSTEYTIIPDRVETGTYMVAAAITNGDILLKDTRLSLLESVVLKLREIGVEIEEVNEGVHITSSSKFHPVDIVTEVYPGFPTDMQPIVAPLLSIADGESTIKETIFDRRFNHVPELRKMGADIKVSGDTIFINGVSKLKGAEVEALDIRSGGSLVLAGLIAEGETTIYGVHQVFRGYEKPLEKLKNVGAELYCINC